MNFFDVIFPLNIGPLTYRRPAGYDGHITAGVPVKAEVKNTQRYGIVLRATPGVPDGPVKEIAEVVREEPLYSKELMRLVSWMAEYYITPEGIVLKSMLPKEVFEKPGRVKAGSATEGRQYPAETYPVDSAILSPIRESVLNGRYGTYLLQVPSLRHEISFISEMIKGIRNIIILAPEISFIERISAVVHELAGVRLAILHGQLSKAERRSSLHRVMSGEADIIIGTRPGIFAPLKSVSLLIVLQEHNRSYKNLEGLRYHARDVAVMRGYLEKATVVLSSPTPSLESFYNTVKGKYILLQSPEQFRRPRIEVVNMRTAKKETPYLSRRSLEAAASYIKSGGNVLFFINRKGYSLIQCADCDDIPSCPECAIPLIYHKNRMVLKCHYCNHTSKAPEYCGKCGSPKFEMVGAGTQRIASDIKKHLAIEPLRIDEDALRDNPELKGLQDNVRGENIIVGTKALAGRLRSKASYDLCVFLNPDIGLHLPDFRSSETLFQEIFGISEFVKTDGVIIVQTRIPGNSVYKYVKSYRFNDFFSDELAARKSLMYPPFSRLIGITISSGTDIGKTLLNVLASQGDEVETIGPLALPRKGRHVWKILMRSHAKDSVTRHARKLLQSLKNEKGLRIVVDVDPISV